MIATGPALALADYSAAALEVYARSAEAGLPPRDYALAGRSFRVRFGSAALAAQLGPALAHLAAPPAAGAFEVYAWGGDQPGGALPPPPWEALPYFERGNVRGYHGVDFTLAYDRRPHTFSLVDHTRQVGVYWAREAARLPFYERAAPLRRLLPAWRQPDGLFVTHAAAVGLPAGGALLAGRTGSGKSTTAALCAAGLGGTALRFAGDDYILVEPGHPPQLHALYNTAKLNRTVLAWVPELHAAIANADQLAIEKALIYVGERVINGFPLRAILLPHPTHHAATTAQRVTAEAAYKALLPDTLFTILGPARPVTAALSALVRAVPCYALALGTDTAGVPRAIEAVLAEAAANA